MGAVGAVGAVVAVGLTVMRMLRETHSAVFTMRAEMSTVRAEVDAMREQMMAEFAEGFFPVEPDRGRHGSRMSSTRSDADIGAPSCEYS